MNHGARRVAGRFGRALEFDGVDDYVSCPAVGELRHGSVEAWVKLLKPMKGQAGFVTFGMGYGQKNDVAILGASPSTPPAAGRVPSSFRICAGEWQAARGAGGLELGRWHHLVGVWGKGGLKVYVDGRLAGENPAYVGSLPSHAAVLLGAGSWNTHTACVVDEVRVYSVALSPETVARHFAQPDYVGAPPQPAGRARGLVRAAVANVADFFDPDAPTCGIQRAIDSLPRSGGVVTIPPGTYVLKRSIRPRSRVTLQGAGPSTVLTRGAQADSLLAKSTVKGARTFTVQSADGFEVGSEIGIHSRKLYGWHTTHAIVTAVRGSVIEIDRPLQKAYGPPGATVAINYFPAICATSLNQVVVQDICIDGNPEENPGPRWIDFTFEAIHFHDTSDSAIRRCTVRGWPSDGIGVQGGSNVEVCGCEVSGCKGHGYHPGTGVQHAIFTGNISHHNGVDGFYFCVRVRHSIVSNNVFHHNRRDGIGGLGGGGDRYNVVANNVCEANGQYGINACGGSENLIANNFCLNNSQSKPGAFAGIGLGNATHTLVTGNRCLDDQAKPTQLVGIHEWGKSDFNLFTSNHLVSKTGDGIKTCGPHSQSQGNLVSPR